MSFASRSRLKRRERPDESAAAVAARLDHQRRRELALEATIAEHGACTPENARAFVASLTKRLTEIGTTKGAP